MKPGAAKPGECAVVAAGLWPGVHRPDPQTAGATRSLWMDQNCSLVHYLRAHVSATAAACSAYRPIRTRASRPNQWWRSMSLELALVGRVGFRRELPDGSAPAVSRGAVYRRCRGAWRRGGKLGGTAQMAARPTRICFVRPPLPIVTVLVDGGDFSQEIAHLTFRHNVSPALVPAT